MDSRIKQFRAGVAALGGVRRGVRYPDTLKRLALSYWHDAERAGESPSGVAAELEISPATLERWASMPEEHAEVGEIQEVILAQPMLATASGLSLVTPDGYRIEGLRAGDVPELLRVLR